MQITYKSSTIFVSNIASSRWFYETVLGLVPTIDANNYVAYEGGVAIWLQSIAGEAIHGEPYVGDLGSNNFELYFETEHLDMAWKKMEEIGVKVHSKVEEHPWGQRSFRLYDPDDYIVEIGESMGSVVIRLNKSMSVEEISKKTYLSKEAISNYLK
ncbi:MAG: VOC family protein [Nitrospinota bacterium]